MCESVLHDPDRYSDWDDEDGITELKEDNLELWDSVDVDAAERTWDRDYKDLWAKTKKRRAESSSDRYVGAVLKRTCPAKYWSLEFERKNMRPDYFSECCDNELWAWKELRDRYVKEAMGE